MTLPLTHPDCDLQDFPFMPLHVSRLRDSDLAATVDPEAAWYAVMLWAASWHQIPAASLPDDEMVLTRLCGLGRDVKTFRKCRSGAMHGFILCSDGRWYHPVVAEQANAAWKAKQEQRWRTECARIKKHNQRHGTDFEFPSLDEFIDSGCHPVPLTIPSKSSECPQSVSHDCPQGHGEDVSRENTSKRQGEGQRQGDIIIDAYASGGSAPEIDEADGENLKPEHFVEAWNELAARLGRPQVRDLTPERRQKLKARINGHTIEDFQQVLGSIEKSPFLRGERNWPGATFDWVLGKGNFQKILEGNYNS